MAGSWNTEPGLNHVGAFQVSGRPYLSGGINVAIDALAVANMDGSIVFPYVTRWFKVINYDTQNELRVGLNISGVTGSNNYITVPINSATGSADTGVLELKVAGLYLSGSTNCAVVAGLTSIPTKRVETSTGPNWSGSTGVG